MKTRRSTRLLGVGLLVIGLLGLLSFPWVFPPDESRDRGGDGVSGAGGTESNSDGSARRKSEALNGSAALAVLRENGRHESLGAALAAARHAVEKIDPDGAHSRGAEYFAANPGQQLRAWFSGAGVELASGMPTPDGEDPWNVQLKLRGMGRGEDVAVVEAGVVVGEGSRVEVGHEEGPVTQWFENGVDGLEQGFTLEEAPRGEAGEVVLVMEVDGSLRAGAMDGPDGVCFVDVAGAEVLHYSGLKAWDAEGRDLPARMVLRGADTLALLVSDAGARYPVTIDPMFANVEARLIQESLAGNALGGAVALAGETALVGSAHDATPSGDWAGSAYVFIRTGGTWRVQAKLTGSDAAASDQFGTSVALSGDTAVIGSPYDDELSGDNVGSAYVFVRSGGTWSEEAKLSADDAAESDYFGISVALSADRVLVGASQGNSAAGQSTGSAYVFARSGGTWSQEAKLTAGSNATDRDEFGRSVALSGDTALVGSPQDDTSRAVEAGSVHVFMRSGAVWSEQTRLTATDGARDDIFGQAVTMSGDTALVGAPGATTPAGPDAGRAYVFVRSGGVWSAQATLKAADGTGGAVFGWSVALEGDAALVGAARGDTAVAVRAGSAYVFVRAGSTWSEKEKLAADDSAQSDGFGGSVALSGGVALVGAPWDDLSEGLGAGSAYVFAGSGGNWSQDAKLTVSDDPESDRLGFSVALDGDTALLGVPFDDTALAVDCGSAYVFARNGNTWREEVKLSAADGGSQNNFGWSVAFSGDTALVGAYRGGSPSWAGSAYVFVRGGGVWHEEAKLTAGPDEMDWNEFGRAVALSGDTALVGAPGESTPTVVSLGGSYVYVRNGGSWSREAKLIASDGGDGDQFGSSVALAGDTALVGAPRDDTPSGDDAGSAYVFRRGGGHWSEEVKLTAADGDHGDEFGRSVALSAETALVGSPWDSTAAGASAGSATVFVRSGTTWSEQAKLTAGDAAGDHDFGRAVALSGEMALVGSRFASVPGEVVAGAAYVFARDGAVWNQQVKLTAGVDASSFDEFGWSVALSGEIALVGALHDDTAGASAGSAYAFLLGELPEIVQQPLSRTVVPGQAVSFDLIATGYAPLNYQWRKDGYLIEGANASSHAIPSAQLADQGNYDCVVSNAGGTVTSAPAALVVNDLSEFTQSFPGAPTEAAGVVLVHLTPPGVGGAWRFGGEQQWRAAGTVALGLTTGDRVIEFRPVPGYLHPPAETVSVVSGGAVTIVNRSYYTAGATGNGGVTVILKPDALADPGVPEVDRAQWRFLGEGGTQWRNSGVTVMGLVPGNYLIECKGVTGRTPPTPANVLVEDGQTSAPILTYSLEHAQTGTAPLVVPFGVISTSADLPYAYVGQIRSDVGASTGFVVRERVVATAGHVVFDDGSLAAVTGLQWLFQRDRGSHEPAPQTPRGFYLFDGYSAQRIVEGTPGSSSPASQELDAAALYFDDPAGRGGFSGFLASDAIPNEWLIANTQKILAGYPVVGVPANQAGRMHATVADDVGFVPGGSVHTYTTDEIRSSGGCSGGPLCVQFEGGSYYPAAIYLGGSGQTVVRVIDSEVIRLFDAAEDSAATGNNNTGGGITLTSVAPVGSPADPGILKVMIEPAAARDAGAGWRLVPDTAWRLSGSQKAGLTPGSYTLECSAVTGFRVPAAQAVLVVGGSLHEVTFTYAAESAELDAWRLAHFGTSANLGDAADGADPDRDGCINIDEFTAGTDPNDGHDCLRVLSMERIGAGFTVEVAGKTGRVYEMQVFEAPATGTPLDAGSWLTRNTLGPLGADATIKLSDPANPVAGALYRVRVTKP